MINKTYKKELKSSAKHDILSVQIVNNMMVKVMHNLLYKIETKFHNFINTIKTLDEKYKTSDNDELKTNIKYGIKMYYDSLDVSQANLNKIESFRIRIIL